MSVRCDLVVVGAGPAGSMAASRAAEAGLDVVLIEKRQEIGSPVRCGEGISRSGLSRILKPDPSWISAEVKGARVYSPDGASICLFGGCLIDEVGYILERKIFDRDLAARAASSGARIMPRTRATGLIFIDGVAGGVAAVSSGKPISIESPIVIGADGVESKVGRWAGICSALRPEDMMVCVQRLVLDRSIDGDYCEFFLGEKSAPGGYIWKLPKGDGIANVGVCIQGSMSEPGAALSLLDRFIKGNMPGSRTLDLVAGGIPISGPIASSTSDGVMLVGDAARQADPFSCGGILNGMNAGIIAGEVAADAISRGDFGKSGLKAYEVRWRKSLGRRMKISRIIRRLFPRLSNEDLNEIVHSLMREDTSKSDLEGLAKMVFRSNPGLIVKMRHLVS